MKAIGLTGGTASGKTTVGGFLTRGRKGVYRFDADGIARAQYGPGTVAHQKIQTALGGYQIYDAKGNIDRKKLSDVAFANPQVMELLQDLTWGPVRRKIEGEISKHRSAEGLVIVIDAALLREAGWDDLVDEVWEVRSSADVRRARLQERNGLSRKEAEVRISAQSKEATRLPDVVIENNTNLAILKKNVDSEWEAFKERHNIEEAQK